MIRRSANRWARSLITRCISGVAGRPTREAKGIAVLKLDRLGDFVLALGAISELVSEFGTDSLLVVSPVAEALARREFPSVPIITMPASQGHARSVAAAWQFRRKLGRVRYLNVVCLRHQRWDYDELVLSWLPGDCHWRIENGFTRALRPDLRTFDCSARGRIDSTWGEQSQTNSAEPDGSTVCKELVRHREVVAHAIKRAPNLCDMLPKLSTHGIGANGCIIVSPMGSDPIRDFPEGLLQTALMRVARQCAAPMIITGTPTQSVRLRSLTERLRCSGLVNLVCREELSFSEYLNLVGGARLVVSAETATAHIAAAFDRPLIAALGGGHYGQCAPWRRSAKQIWISNRVDCYHCDWRCVHKEPICLTQIPVQHVRDAVGRLLE